MIRWSQVYDGGRITASSGLVEVGAVFPPTAGDLYRWRLWLRHPSPIEGWATSEQAAQTALLDAWAAFLIAAGLSEASA